MFFIFGFTPVKKTGQQTLRRHCPHCNDLRNFQEILVRQYISFFFIPIFPVSAATPLFTCSSCGYSIAQELMREAAAPEIPASPAGNPAGQVVILCPRCEGAMALPLSESRQEVTCPHCAMEFKVKGIKDQIPAAIIRQSAQSI
ncbi:zinc ribbon family protein [Hydrogenispora ethanolica]|uniref:Zinc ribbon family protein n=1 Tax=Hydrogenispora ethanolica TaxID=1082276 RepID=A0A4R1QNN1_HYDET|nr:zinc ribbon domain-containing protein [Hydrogenispora ethanolica]TCL55356.1 zinc ribbon family protein [Hydrogenispora ethanolica]